MCTFILCTQVIVVKNSDRERDVSWERLGGGLYDEGLEGGRLVVGMGFIKTVEEETRRKTGLE